MKRFAIVFKTEFILFLRDFFGVFFALAFPVLMLLIFGGIYGNEPVYPGAATGIMDASVPAYSVMVMGVTGLMSFPLTLAGYKEKKSISGLMPRRPGRKRLSPRRQPSMW